MLFDLPKDEPSIIKIIGVGGGGSNAVTYMYKQGIVGVDYAICNTDAQAMELSPVPMKIALGHHLTEGRGAGSKPSVGKQACIDSLDEIKSFLDDGTKMVFITAGMGGGTGTGAAPILAKAAQEMGILTVGIVTLPFGFEGRVRVSTGMEGLEELRRNVDCLVVISNDKLRDIFGNLSISQAFSQADNILCTAAKGIAEIITVPGYVNVDFEDVNTVMRGSGVAIMGTAAAEGDNRALRATDEALNSPLLEDNNIRGAQNILVNITSGGKEATMDEIFQITEFVQKEAGEGANLIWGNCFDERLGEKIAVTVIATGFDSPERRKTIPQPNKQAARPPATPERRNLHLDDDAPTNTPPRPTISSILSDAEPFVEEEKAAKSVEFDFNDIRESVDKFRGHSSIYDEPFVRPIADDVSPEERRRRLEEAQRRREEIRNRPINVVRLSSPQTIIDLESQPAYLRRNVHLDDVPDAAEPGMSPWTISIEDETEINLGGNRFLHDNVD
jgi:cell division protein FtsZ